MADKAVVELNVGGTLFASLQSTLNKYPDSGLAKMISNVTSTPKDASGRIFIDRDGEAFKLILEFLRNGQLPSNATEKERFRNEAQFYGLAELVKQLDLPATNRLSVPRGSIFGDRDRQKACITLGYRGTFAFGKDGLIDVKFRKLGRILVAGRVAVCREVFTDTLNESRDPDHGDAECRYSSRLYLKHSCIEQAFDMLYENGFRLVTACGTNTSTVAGESLKPGVDPEESKWQHYNEFVFVRE